MAHPHQPPPWELPEDPAPRDFHPEAPEYVLPPTPAVAQFEAPSHAPFGDAQQYLQPPPAPAPQAYVEQQRYVEQPGVVPQGYIEQPLYEAQAPYVEQPQPTEQAPHYFPQGYDQPQFDHQQFAQPAEPLVPAPPATRGKRRWNSPPPPPPPSPKPAPRPEPVIDNVPLVLPGPPAAASTPTASALAEPSVEFIAPSQSAAQPVAEPAVAQPQPLPVEPPAASATGPVTPFVDEDDEFEATVVVPRGKTATQWKLIDLDGTAYPLHISNVLGRKPSQNDAPDTAQLVALSDAKRVLSRTHALLEVIDDALFVTDLGSTNGTEVRDASGAVLHECQPHERERVPQGGSLSLGGRVVSFESPNS